MPARGARAQEYASGGELFERIIEAGRLPEAEARFYFQQLISGIAYCHKEARAPARQAVAWHEVLLLGVAQISGITYCHKEARAPVRQAVAWYGRSIARKSSEPGACHVASHA